MTDFSDFLENKVLDHVYRNTSYTPPAAVYLALYSATPSDAGGGTEMTGTGYARQAITFGAASGGVISNTSAVTFTAGGAWASAVAVGVFDALTTGNLLAWKAITASGALASSDQLSFPIGQLSITQT